MLSTGLRFAPEFHRWTIPVLENPSAKTLPPVMGFML